MERYEARHLLKALKDGGWYLGDTAGACRQYVHRTEPGVITVHLRHTDELGPETRASAEAPRLADPDIEPTVTLESTSTGFSTHSAEWPGCVASGSDEDDARRRMGEAVELHRSGLRKARR